MKKTAHNATPEENRKKTITQEGGGGGSARDGKKERPTCPPPFSLLPVCGMTSLCTAAVFVNQGRPGVFVGQFLWQEGGKRGRKKRKKRERKKRRGEERES